MCDNVQYNVLCLILSIFILSITECFIPYTVFFLIKFDMSSFLSNGCDYYITLRHFYLQNNIHIHKHAIPVQDLCFAFNFSTYVRPLTG